MLKMIIRSLLLLMKSKILQINLTIMKILIIMTSKKNTNKKQSKNQKKS